MTGRDAPQECVLNSVDWYRSISRAHGLASAIDGQLAVVRALTDALEGPFTVKDSHSVLDLAPLGFRILFDAEWIRLAPSAVSAGEAERWRQLVTPDDLRRWEDAWRAHGSPASTQNYGVT